MFSADWRFFVRGRCRCGLSLHRLGVPWWSVRVFSRTASCLSSFWLRSSWPCFPDFACRHSDSQAQENEQNCRCDNPTYDRTEVGVVPEHGVAFDVLSARRVKLGRCVGIGLTFARPASCLKAVDARTPRTPGGTIIKTLIVVAVSLLATVLSEVHSVTADTLVGGKASSVKAVGCHSP